MDARFDVVRRRDHAFGAAQEFAEQRAPGGDVERPLRRPRIEACRATRRRRFAAVTTLPIHQMVLRADRVVQRAVVGDASRPRQVEDRRRQAMHVMEVQARNADRVQHPGKHGQVGGQAKVRGERLAVARPMQLHGAIVRRLQIQHVGALEREA